MKIELANKSENELHSIKQESKHLYFIDNLKVVLIMLVVVHHAGQAYGPGGWWYFIEGEYINWLGKFFAVNAAFFMYYIYIFFGLGNQPTDWSGPSWPDMQFGHLWFLQHLLVYALILAVWSILFPLNKASQSFKGITGYQITRFLLVVTVATFITRIWYPIDYWTNFLGIIQTEFAHVPQYVSFFILGILASRRKWLVNLDTRIGFIWLSIGMGIVAILYFSGNTMDSLLLKGGANVGSFARSLIETLLSISLTFGLLVLFREKVNRINRLSAMLTSNVYVVYFIHVPIVVFLQYALTDMPLTVVTKFIITAFLGILFSFLLSHFIWRRIPYLKNLM